MGETATQPSSTREPSPAVRGDPMLLAVGALEAAMQLSGAGTSGSPPPPRSKPPEPPASKADDLLAKQRAHNERMEAELGAQRAELEAQTVAQQAAQQALRENAARRDTYQKNPAKLLEEAGLTIEELAESVLNDWRPTPALLARAAQEDVAELRAELAARDKHNEQAKIEAQRAEREEARAAIRGEIDSLVQMEPEKYEAIAFHRAENAVYAEMEQAFRKGEELTPSEAADRVEKRLAEKIEGALKTRKFAARLRQQGVQAVAHPGSDPMDKAVGDLIARGWARF